MARTYKDSRRKYHFKDYWTQDHIPVEGFGYRLAKTSKPKLRKEVDNEDHWYSKCPAWWCRLFMNVPQRRAGSIWEKAFVNTTIDLNILEEVDYPGCSRKPHKYYY